MPKSISIPTAILAAAMTSAVGAGITFALFDQPDSAVDTRYEAEVDAPSCNLIASEEQATALLNRLFPKAKIITAEPLLLGDIKSSCLLEVEMMADAEKPETRGFVYVLPDGQTFLNGPLMDKRSKVALEAPSADIGKALEEQQKAIETIMAARPAPQHLQPHAEPRQVDSVHTNQLIGSFPTPTKTADIPSVEEIRMRLISKMETLPSLLTGEGSKVVHVLVDPLCGYCKKLHQDSEELSAQHGVRFNWIPIFLNEGSWAMSALVLKELAKSPKDATDLFAKMMQGKWSGTQAEAAITMLNEEDYAAVKPAAGLFIELAKTNPRIGTPLVVFEKSEGGIEVISGLPTGKDWETL